MTELYLVYCFQLSVFILAKPEGSGIHQGASGHPGRPPAPPDGRTENYNPHGVSDPTWLSRPDTWHRRWWRVQGIRVREIRQLMTRRVNFVQKRLPVCLVQPMIFFRFLYFQQVPCVVLSGTFPVVWHQHRNRNLFSLISHIAVIYLHYYDDEFLEIGYDNFQHSESGQFFFPEPLSLINLELVERFLHTQELLVS